MFANKACNEQLQEQSKSIKTLNDLKEEISRAESKGAISNAKANSILSQTQPSVIKEYVEFVDTQVSNKMENSIPDDILYDPVGDKSTQIYHIDVDGLSHADVTIIDQEEMTPVEETVEKIKNAMASPVYAATNNEIMWKSYAKDGSKKPRYFTAKYKRYVGTGYGVFCTENHYYVSSKGIQERYGESWVDSFFGVTIDVEGKGHTIEDEWAKKVDEDAHIKTRWNLKQTVGYGGNNAYYYRTIYERTKITYLQKDAANHRLKVKHSWSKIS